MSRSQSTIFTMTPFDSKYQNLQQIATHVCISSYPFRDINFSNVYLQKVFQGHEVQYFH